MEFSGRGEVSTESRDSIDLCRWEVAAILRDSGELKNCVFAIFTVGNKHASGGVGNRKGNL